MSRYYSRLAAKPKIEIMLSATKLYVLVAVAWIVKSDNPARAKGIERVKENATINPEPIQPQSAII